MNIDTLLLIVAGTLIVETGVFIVLVIRANW